MRIGRQAMRTALAAGTFLSGANVLDDKLTSPLIETYRPQKTNLEIPISRKIVNPADRSGLNLRLFQYQSCPFCSKVRAFLDYYGFSYEVVEVNPVTKSQLRFSKDYKKVPVVTSCAGTYVESSLIVSQLATYLRRPDCSLPQIQEMYPTYEGVNDKGKKVISCPNKYVVMKKDLIQDENVTYEREEREWREWVDNYFIHLISPNIYRTFSESLETFEWFSKYGDWETNFSTANRLLAKYVGAAIMLFVAKRLKKRHHIDDERKALSDAFNEWMRAIGPDRRFLGGDTPNLADLAMYGAMLAFSGCSAFKEVMSNNPIQHWYDAMQIVVQNHEGRHMLAARTKHLEI